MNLFQNKSLLHFNTFGINASCKLFMQINSVKDIDTLINSKILESEKYFIMGGGSNVLFTRDFDGLIIKMENQIIDTAGSNNEFVWVKADAGVLWSDLVDFALTSNLSGIENLIGIPGTAGASAFQNIGAYGAEAKDCIEEVDVINLHTGSRYTLKNKDCNFDYRNSIFKENKSRSEIIYSVTYRLSVEPKINTSYGDIQRELEKQGVARPSIQDIASVIKKIRDEKIPDPQKVGNGGSFFKNPIIPTAQYHLLKETFPKITAYPEKNDFFKISAGWLIDQCGWKGKSNGKAGVHEKQALMLVNLGGASGKDIQKLAEMIQDSVKEKFNIKLESEVIIL